MILQHLNIGSVSQEEMIKLTISQATILAAWRQLQDVTQVADCFGKDPEAVKQMLFRIRRRGVGISRNAA